MDPAPDPPPPPPPPPYLAAVAANPTPAHPPVNDHPPYAEMITAAISALKERNGSSKRAIAKYIETHYSNLPPTHSALLTNHLRRLKVNGQILMVKQSYKLPGSAPVVVNSVSSDPASAGPKRRPGRPPKPKPDSVQDAVPVFAPPVDMNAEPGVVPAAQPPPNADIGLGSVYVPGGQINGPAAGGAVRGRGRPPKRGGAKRGPGRPPKVGGVGGGRGRPRKNSILAARKKGLGRPRGRPPKPVNVIQGLAPGVPAGVGMEAASAALGGGLAPVGVKRRGRPPKAGGVAKKPRKLSGKPLGRPRKNQLKTSDSQLLVAYLDLKAKLENLQSRVQQTAAFIKPSVNNEAAFNALQELELVAMNINVPSNAQNQQQQQQLPQPEQPHPQPQPPQSF